MPSIVAVLSEIVQWFEETPWDPIGTKNRLHTLNDAQLKMLMANMAAKVAETSPKKKVNLNFHAKDARPPLLFASNEMILKFVEAEVEARRLEKERLDEEEQQLFLQEHGKELRKIAEAEQQRRMIAQVRLQFHKQANDEVRTEENDRSRVAERQYKSRKLKAQGHAEKLIVFALFCFLITFFCLEYLIIEAFNLAITMAAVFSLTALACLFLSWKIRQIPFEVVTEEDIVRMVETRTDDYMAKWDLDRRRRERRAKEERRARRRAKRERKQAAGAAKDLAAKRRRDFTTGSARDSMASDADSLTSFDTSLDDSSFVTSFSLTDLESQNTDLTTYDIEGDSDAEMDAKLGGPKLPPIPASPNGGHPTVDIRGEFKFGDQESRPRRTPPPDQDTRGNLDQDQARAHAQNQEQHQDRAAVDPESKLGDLAVEDIV